MAFNFMKLTIGLSMAIIGTVVAAEMLAGTYSTLTTSLNTLNTSMAGASLWRLVQGSGVIPLIVVAVFVIAIIVGLFSLVKSR